MKVENGDWRSATAKETMREIRQHLLLELGPLTFDEVTPSLLRNLLRTKAEGGSGEQVLSHLRAYITDICKCAVAEGYLRTNVSEGLKVPTKLVKPKAPKRVATLEEYAQAWNLLAERERLCFDLVMFAGMRESEAFAIKCGDVAADGIHIERSWYRGEFGPPKTKKSDRVVGVPDGILERLRDWISKLKVNGPRDCAFPSTKLATPIWPSSVLADYIKPVLQPAGLDWVNFAVVRRSHSNLHKNRRSDLKIIADQQGHSMRTHMEEYVQSGLEERKAEASKLYADFKSVLNERG
jgi:integrase